MALSSDKKTLILNVVEFLTAEIADKQLSEEKRESIEVAIQCLESSYEIANDDKARLPKTDLLGYIRSITKQDISDEDVRIAEQHKTLGNNAVKSGQYEEAIAQYTKAIASNPKNAVYYCNRAAAYSRLDKNYEAINDCNKALELDPNYGKAHGRLGIAYSNLNKWAEAVTSYENSLRFDPNNESYKINLELAKQRLLDSMESAAPPQHRPIDISQFINNDSFRTMAQEMMSSPDFQNIMSGIMAMSQSGDNTFEALVQAGQNLASHMQNRDPSFVENLRRQFNINPAGGSTDPQPNSQPDGAQDGTDKSNQK